MPKFALAVYTLLFGALMSAALGSAYAAPPEGRHPNVLFIAIDDLNDWTGALGGHPQAKTPHLDRLAERGVLFTNAHCAAPACNPSRAALMTGVLPVQSGVYYNSNPWRPALPDAVTIPQHFTRHGYWSAGSGKIFHGSFLDPASWDEYFPSKTRSRYADPVPPSKNINGLNRSHFDWGPLDVADNEMGDAQTVEWIRKQLGRKRDDPFFLACGLFRPHLPWYVPRKYFDMFPLESMQLPTVPGDDLDDVPAAGVRMAKPDGDHAAVIKHDQWKHAVQGYLASIAFTDTQLGRVLDALDQGPHRDDTVVVLWTDHGWHLGEKMHWRKFALWEEATRTPMMMVVPQGACRALPQGTPRGRRCEQPASLMDIYPTLIELCGLKPRDDIAGKSLVPLLENPATRWDRAVVTTHGRGNHGVRDQRWRYIRYADGGEELYDHEADPAEWKNLAADPEYKEVVARLAKYLPTSEVKEAPRTPVARSGGKKKKTRQPAADRERSR